MREQAEYRDALYEKPSLRQLAIELTLACNCKCRHCGSNCGSEEASGGMQIAAGASGKQTGGAASGMQMPAGVSGSLLTDHEILESLARLKEDMAAAGEKLPFVFATGGEPLLRKNAAELMGSIKALGYSWGMTTNGMFLDEGMAKSLKDAGIYSASISLDGLEETHDWFRRTQHGFQKALEGVRHMVCQGIGNVMVTTVVHKKNIGELEQLYEVVRETGCDTWRVVNLEPIGRALEYPELMLEPADYRRMLEFIKAKNGQGLKVEFGCNHFTGYENEFEVRPWFFMCQSGIRVMSIQSNGDITGCLDIKRGDEAAGKKIIQGNIKTDRLYEVWKNRFAFFRQRKAIDSQTCRGCKYLYECDGGGFHTWDITQGEPMLCMVEMLQQAAGE